MKYLLCLKNNKIEESEDLNKLIKKSNTMPGSKVTTEDGKLVHLFKPITVPPEKKLHGGEVIKLRNVRVYKKGAITPFAVANGIYYIFNGRLINGRYAITKNKNDCNGDIKKIYGYINKMDFRV